MRKISVTKPLFFIDFFGKKLCIGNIEVIYDRTTRVRYTNYIFHDFAFSYNVFTVYTPHRYLVFDDPAKLETFKVQFTDTLPAGDLINVPLVCKKRCCYVDYEKLAESVYEYLKSKYGTVEERKIPAHVRPLLRFVKSSIFLFESEQVKHH